MYNLFNYRCHVALWFMTAVSLPSNSSAQPVGVFFRPRPEISDSVMLARANVELALMWSSRYDFNSPRSLGDLC